MSDIALVCSPKDTTSVSIRPRVDWILLHLSAIARREEDKHYPGSKPPSQWIHAAPYWNFKTTITGHEYQAVKSSADYILWHGARGDWDTNLVVVRENILTDGECWAALPIVSLIYAARRSKGYKGGIYGVCTDGQTWTFLHLSDKGHVSFTFEYRLHEVN